MSRVEELIEELCPIGVEYQEIRKISAVLRGKRLTKNQLSETEKYPVFHGGLEPLGYFGLNNRNANTVMVINVGASAGSVGYSTVDFWSSDGCYCIEHSPLIIDRYMYYALLSNQNNLRSKVRYAGIPTLDAKAVEEIRIPLPPLEIQQEIVRILDNFTELTEELTAELTAEIITRKKQYEYYRNSLLAFSSDDIKWFTLGEIGPVCMCKRIMKAETSTDGEVPFYKIGTFGKEANAYISQETYEKYKSIYKFPKKGDILISAAGTIGRTVVYDGTPAYFQDSNIVWIDNDESIVLNKFLIYCYAMKPWNVSTGGTIARLYNDNILKAKIPVPSLEEQEKIVSIIEKFSMLSNNISESLPAEIEARQKQYEYYRDKLLTFKELGA